jgi:D-alanyl-D-alanine carboxypeptidase (penicillin-binding protein 5/6)
MQLQDFSMMVRTVMMDIRTVDGKRHIPLYNTNELLLDPDVTGVKTGYTSNAGRCLIATVFKDDHRLLLVGLNLVDQWEQAAQLLRYGEAIVRGASD